MATRITKSKKQPRRSRKKPKFSKVAVTLLLLTVLAFTITMIVVYVRTGGIPDTLVTAFYAFAGGEAGFLGLIKHSDNKYNSGGSGSAAG